MSTMQVIVADALYWYGRLESAGISSKTAEQATALVKETASRLASLYKASTIVSPPPEASDIHDEVLRAFGQRQKWFNETLDRLDKGVTPDAVPPAQDIASAQNGLKNLAAKFGLKYPVETPSVRILKSDRLQLSVSFTWDWIVADADPQVVLIAPLELQKPGLASLGLSAEKYGSAFKVWGTKNPAAWDLSRADQEAQLYFAPLGNELSRQNIAFDGSPGLLRILSNGSQGWKSMFIVAVKGNYTYMVEAGCPMDVFDKCRQAFQNIIDGIKLTG